MKVLFILLFIIIAVIGEIFLFGWVLTIGWEWFLIESLLLPPLPYSIACVLVFAIKGVANEHVLSMDNDNNVWNIIGKCIICPFFLLFIFYIAKLFIDSNV